MVMHKCTTSTCISTVGSYAITHQKEAYSDIYIGKSVIFLFPVFHWSQMTLNPAEMGSSRHVSAVHSEQKSGFRADEKLHH